MLSKSQNIPVDNLDSFWPFPSEQKQIYSLISMVNNF